MSFWQLVVWTHHTRFLIIVTDGEIVRTLLISHVGRLPEVTRHDSRDARVGGEAPVRPEEGAGRAHGAVEEATQVS